MKWCRGRLEGGSEFIFFFLPFSSVNGQINMDVRCTNSDRRRSWNERERERGRAPMEWGFARCW